MLKKSGLIVLFALFEIATMAQQDTIVFAVPQKLSEQVNTEAEESLPLITADGETMYFARTFHPANAGGKMAGQDIWFAVKSGDQFKRAQNLSPLNNKRNNAVVGIARNGSRMYLLNQFPGKRETKAGLSISEYSDSLGTWEEPRPVNVPNLSVEGSFYSAYVSADEDFILWTIPVENDTMGNDLFISESSDRGDTWSEPRSLGLTINSDLDEISPFYDPKRKLLFFSRNKSSNADDYDIYYAKKRDESWTDWSDPVAATALNSPKFDAYYFSDSNDLIYFSSNRSDSLSNLFLSEYSEFKPEIIETDTVELAQVEREVPDPVLIIETEDGTSTTTSLSSLTREQLLSKSTNIRFVYFDFDKYNISAKYIEVLDDAGEILDKNPDINLKIIGHTDAIGSHEYNQILSENRARSTKEYLLIHGVEPGRIDTEGMGKREPYASNLTE
ncbi:MAG TPA: OmpA family protein, partial [Cryomorphaceae bacterium]|nr:OmpA family protein [Cryomorphaceae bacterium]